MGEIKDRNGNVLNIGDTICIGNDDVKLKAEIEGFRTLDGGTQLMVQTRYGDINLTLVEKCVS